MEVTYATGSIAEAIARQGNRLEIFDAEDNTVEKETNDSNHVDNNEDEEYARMMEIKRLIAEDPDWIGRMERELNKDDSDDRDDGEEAVEDSNAIASTGGTDKPNDNDAEEVGTEKKRKKKKRRRRKKKGKEEEAQDGVSAPDDVQGSTKGGKKGSAPVSPSSSPSSGIESINSDMTKNETSREKKRTRQPELVIADETKTVYVGNLHFDITESALKGKLSDAIGAVEKVYLVKNNKGKGAGFAYATFQSKASVDDAINVAEKGTDVVIEGRAARFARFDKQSLYRRNGKRKAKRKR